MSKLASLVILSMATLVLVACGSSPIKDPDQAERLLAAKYAIAVDYRLANLTNTCKSLSVSTRQHAHSIQQQWRDRNWPLVDAADKEFQAYIKDKQLKFGKEAGQLPALRYLMELEEKYSEETERLTRHEAHRDERCIRALDEYTEPGMQLAENEVRHAHLQYLRRYYGDKIDEPRAVPVISTAYRAQRNSGGKSLYKVEKIVAKQLCENFDVLSLLQQGPKEVYGIFCENQANHLIKCKWGQCKVLQE